MRVLELTTPNRERYYIHDNGDIERTDIPGFTVSGKWKAVGVASVHPFARHYEPHLTTLYAIADGQDKAVYKNGRPRYTLVDLDHGTIRVWGNSAHYGIASVRRVR